MAEAPGGGRRLGLGSHRTWVPVPTLPPPPAVSPCTHVPSSLCLGEGSKYLLLCADPVLNTLRVFSPAIFIRILQMRKLRLEETNKEKPKVSSVTRRSGWVGGYLGGSGRCCSHPHPQASWPARKEGLAQSRRLRDFLQQNCVSRLVQRRGGLGKPPLTGYSTVTTLDQKGETAFSREVHSAEERRLEKR